MDSHSRSGASQGWGIVYQTLIDHGHAPRDIGQYTKRQVLLYYRCAIKIERTRRAESVLDMNQAHAGGEDATAHFKGLLE